VGIGDWGLGIGDWGLGVGPNPQSPIPNPQYFYNIYISSLISNIKNNKFYYIINNFIHDYFIKFITSKINQFYT